MARLERFKAAQSAEHAGFEAALRELQSGRKQGHWIWYVFPQLSGLGSSSLSIAYGINGVDEAAEYLRDPVLRGRLLAVSSAVLEQVRTGVPLDRLMGSRTDVLKLVSSLTLFSHVAASVDEVDGSDDRGSLAAMAGEVLAAAASQGFTRCPYTAARLR